MIKQISASPSRLLIATTAFVIWTVLVDQALKGWATGLSASTGFLGLQIFPFRNAGIFGGYLADLDPWIVRIFFSVLFGFLAIGTLLAFHFLKHKRVPFLKVGLVVYFAGVLGNVWDRMTTGMIVDYIVVRLPGLPPMAYNFADCVVFAGFILIVISIFRESNEFWYGRNQRKGYWIDSGFQRGFGIWIALVGFAHFFVIGLYSYIFLKVFIVPDHASAITPDRIMRDYLFGLCVIEGAGLVLTFAASIIFSHRMVGPLIALDHFVARRRGRDSATLPPFRARRADYFKTILESIAARL